MDEHSQIVVPASFVALFVEPGRIKASASREHIEQRHEFCEDLAQLLAQRAAELGAELGVPTEDLVQRIARGLHDAAAGLEEREAQWVRTRLEELLR